MPNGVNFTDAVSIIVTMQTFITLAVAPIFAVKLIKFLTGKMRSKAQLLALHWGAMLSILMIWSTVVWADTAVGAGTLLSNPEYTSVFRIMLWTVLLCLAIMSAVLYWKKPGDYLHDPDRQETDK